jgi:hypothetical protein
MLLTAICEDGYKVASIEKISLKPSAPTQSLEADPHAHRVLLDSLPTLYHDHMSEGVNYLLVVTTSGVGIEEVICRASERERDDLMAEANTLNALAAVEHDSYSIIKIVLFR